MILEPQITTIKQSSRQNNSHRSQRNSPYHTPTSLLAFTMISDSLPTDLNPFLPPEMTGTSCKGFQLFGRGSKSMKKKFYTKISLLYFQPQTMHNCQLRLSVYFNVCRKRSQFIFLEALCCRWDFLPTQCFIKNRSESVNIRPWSNPLCIRVLLRCTVSIFQKFFLAGNPTSTAGSKINQLQIPRFIKHQVIRA